MNKTDKCPICGQTSPSKYGHIMQPAPDFEIGDAKWPTFIQVEYDSCRMCGAIFQNPMMDQDHLDYFYSSGMYRDHFNSKNADEDELQRAKRLAEFLKEKRIVPGTHLDIGSSRGMFLAEVNAEEQKGIEPNIYYNTNKRAHIFRDMLGLILDFDLISCIHVLEHVADPMDLLERCFACTKRGGWFLLEVPSDLSPGGASRLSHTYVFQGHTLISMLQKVGFKLESIGLTPHWLILCRKL